MSAWTLERRGYTHIHMYICVWPNVCMGEYDSVCVHVWVTAALHIYRHTEEIYSKAPIHRSVLDWMSRLDQNIIFWNANCSPNGCHILYIACHTHGKLSTGDSPRAKLPLNKLVYLFPNQCLSIAVILIYLNNVKQLTSFPCQVFKILSIEIS